MTNNLSLRDALAMMWRISVGTLTLPPSTLFRSHGVEISEDGLDGLAIGCVLVSSAALTVLTYVSMRSRRSKTAPHFLHLVS